MKRWGITRIHTFWRRYILKNASNLLHIYSTQKLTLNKTQTHKVFIYGWLRMSCLRKKKRMSKLEKQSPMLTRPENPSVVMKSFNSKMLLYTSNSHWLLHYNFQCTSNTSYNSYGFFTSEIIRGSEFNSFWIRCGLKYGKTSPLNEHSVNE